MNAQQKENVKNWVKELRSGHYLQTKGQLRTTLSFCCIGVLADVIDPEAWKQSGSHMPSWENSGVKSRTSLPESLFLEITGLQRTQAELIKLNDDGKPFCYIADHIERTIQEEGL
jgi:hypothetical protein